MENDYLYRTPAKKRLLELVRERLVLLIATGLLLGVAVSYAFYVREYRHQQALVALERDSRHAPLAAGGSPGRSVEVRLYFALPSDAFEKMLQVESRQIPEPESEVELARALVQALAEGPQGGLHPAVPPETRLLHAFLDPDGTAYLDFSREIASRHPGGTEGEWATIYSIVQTLCANLPRMRRVKFLVDGREAQTLAGHLSLRAPFEPLTGAHERPEIVEEELKASSFSR